MTLMIEKRTALMKDHPMGWIWVKPPGLFQQFYFQYHKSNNVMSMNNAKVFSLSQVGYLLCNFCWEKKNQSTDLIKTVTSERCNTHPLYHRHSVKVIIINIIHITSAVWIMMLQNRMTLNNLFHNSGLKSRVLSCSFLSLFQGTPSFFCIFLSFLIGCNLF